MATQTITFIGGGNMASSLIGGLIADGTRGETLWVSDPDEERLGTLSEHFDVHTTGDNREAATRGETVIFAVKPQVMADVVREVAGELKRRQPLIVSIAAGVREPDIRRWLGYDAAIVRVMPNTPALLRTGASGLYANAKVSPAQRNRAESVLRAVGVTVWLEDEGLMDAVTAVSGSGPAYFFLLMELMERAGNDLGLPRETARLLTLQTAMGAAKMALESADEPAALRERVTSPGGTTERALQTLLEGGLERLITDALRAARERATELGEMLGRK
ncbi:MAG: pyrroline-5-carboxylate reductase [Gammaproteobacteria bacterium]|nr:pyrroline-5-carboxylate reductase [Gammaproteobacteria bacterium]NIR82718.1 pyrroline-5-carboxylate reductase [Gammaproteobacteria bacterium]NIR89582.1 pyrroline-5-carboxylate reductase [Gammaproteobacteria bacterium]NIU03878.1 pyrroline-5-carboxylate reductase [Gammaproteobacteria bacterium]NIV51194.1 pyrroline-5-carboxylate reductase [Gammaproteobacteria bacterium]